MINKTRVDKKFLNLFTYSSISSPNDNLHLFTLKIQNNRFLYQELSRALHGIVINFCLSPREINEISNPGIEYVEAVNKFRDYNSNHGELGELLLYSLLETHLEAPKLLSKMMLKTSTNDYVKGADGIHIRELEDGSYHMIFGESKLNQSYQTGLYRAFHSINEYLTREKNNIYHEIRLVNSHLKNEFVEKDEAYEFLKKIIIPSEDEVEIDNAFSIFVGFEIDFTDAELALNGSGFRKMAKDKVEEIILKEVDYIEEKISKYNLSAYPFYIYAMPFTNLETTRTKMIGNLMEAKYDF